MARTESAAHLLYDVKSRWIVMWRAREPIPSGTLELNDPGGSRANSVLATSLDPSGRLLNHRGIQSLRMHASSARQMSGVP